MAMTARAPRHDLGDRRIEAILVTGGDERIALDPRTGLNRYGCGVEPEYDAWPTASRARRRAPIPIAPKCGASGRSWPGFADCRPAAA
jgi:hypothetical protein